ncbi:MAG: flagellar biosynthetic protein FliR [Ignavibacteriaceae bacterium]|jgi:flagellar biosynthetic protein FliR|nr:flagellar biosynthetic protein FliR [Ignavibacteriaceae bacterium]
MTDILVVDFILLILIFVRIASAFFASPIMGHTSIPALVKIFLGLIISYIVFLSIDKSAIKIEVSLWFLAANAVKEILSGLLIGFMLHIVFFGISFAGSLIGFDMGLSMAEAFNPMEETQGNVIGELIYFATILLFFLIDGHHYLIRGLVYSFSVIPIGKFTVTVPVYQLLIKYSGLVFIIAIKIASPILVSFFLISIAEGIISRIIPQMQVFFVTQPLRIGIGFLFLTTLIPIYVYAIKGLLKGFEDNLFTLIKAMGS